MPCNPLACHINEDASVEPTVIIELAGPQVLEGVGFEGFQVVFNRLSIKPLYSLSEQPLWAFTTWETYEVDPLSVLSESESASE